MLGIRYIKHTLGKTGFQIEESDLIQIITEDRLRQAIGPVQIPPFPYIHMHIKSGQILTSIKINL